LTSQHGLSRFGEAAFIIHLPSTSYVQFSPLKRINGDSGLLFLFCQATLFCNLGRI
jgi:hypothetical protein